MCPPVGDESQLLPFLGIVGPASLDYLRRLVLSECGSSLHFSDE